MKEIKKCFHIKTFFFPLASFAPLRPLREKLRRTAPQALTKSFLLIICLVSCQAQQQRQSSADFYQGLKKRQAEARSEASAAFEKALGSSNMHIASAAAAELMSMHYSGAEIPPATINKIREKAPAMLASKASGSWAMALDALGKGSEPDKEKILALSLNNTNRSPDEAIQYLLMEVRALNAAANNSPGMFSNAENAAIAGRIAVTHSRYREALIFFRMVMAEAPGLFFRYPELLSDLGRSFQYSAPGREGIDLFLQWEKNFDDNADLLPIMDENLAGLVRFRLLFYAARMARQSGLPESVDLFERALLRALALPPEARGASNGGEQTDACIWYILNISLARDSGRTIRYLENYVTHWRDDSYYLDVMDKLARGLLLKRNWTDIINIFAIVKNRPGVIRAKFAWIIGRAIQEGLLSPKEIEHARTQLGGSGGAPNGGAPNGTAQDDAEAYIRIAYNSVSFDTASFDGASLFDGKALYYRSLSAASLGEPFLPLPLPAKTQAQAAGDSGAMEFLLGFFRNGAAKFAPRYIRMMESGLSPDELRRLAEALGNEGQYQESMRLVSLYTGRASYQYQRQDLELLYPKPFSEQVSQYAQETGISPAKLYGLIRMESAFNPDAISRSGAIGLTQLMPATAEEMAVRILRRGGPDYTRKSDKESVDEITGDTGAESDAGGGAIGGATGGGLIASEVGVDLLDPEANIHMGAAYLAYLEERLGDPLLALLAYNGGMNRVRRWRNTMPIKFPPDLFLETVEYAETMDYGRTVMSAAAMYRQLTMSN
jgi:soluble lytic murein transglycosylase